MSIGAPNGDQLDPVFLEHALRRRSSAVLARCPPWSQQRVGALFSMMPPGSGVDRLDIDGIAISGSS